MTELGFMLAKLGLSQYLDRFIKEGFETWDTLLDITESDLDALGVKLGHRRKLQRHIASSRGVSLDAALTSPIRESPFDERLPDGDDKAGLAGDFEKGIQGTSTGKRKYRRHPKPDENAPERPPSAYVIFSNKMREELRTQNLSFTEIAKVVGERWQVIAPREKEPFEKQASTAKEQYNAELTRYKKTDNYKIYVQYLADFKAKNATSQQADGKRPKLDFQQSAAGNEHTGDINNSQTPSSSASLLPLGRPRVESISSASNNSTSRGPDSPRQSLSYETTPGTALLATSGLAVISPKSSNATTQSIMAGYREAIAQATSSTGQMVIIDSTHSGDGNYPTRILNATPLDGHYRSGSQVSSTDSSRDSTRPTLVHESSSMTDVGSSMSASMSGSGSGSGLGTTGSGSTSASSVSTYNKSRLDESRRNQRILPTLPPLSGNIPITQRYLDAPRSLHHPLNTPNLSEHGVKQSLTPLATGPDVHMTGTEAPAMRSTDPITALIDASETLERRESSNE